MKKLSAIVLVLTLALTSAAACFADDIDYSQWDSQTAYPSDVVNTRLFAPVKWLVDEKIVAGYPDGLFHAENYVTRAEFTKMVLIATNKANSMPNYRENNTFSDTQGHWAADYIGAAAGQGIITGYPDGTFDPEGNVSYVEAIAIFCRARNISVSEQSWPNNYITYATMYNMYGNSQNVTGWTKADWKKPASREDIAWLIYKNMPK